MLNRRSFLMTIGAVGAAQALRALEVEDDDTIRDILRRLVDVEKRTVGMAVCVVTPNRKRIVAWGRERLGDDRPVTSETVFEIGSVTKVFTALLLGRDSEVVYSGACAQPDDWGRLVDAAGACVVLAGTIGLYAVPDEALTTGRVHHMLDQAARAGALVGGLIVCWPGEVPGAGYDPPAAELADRIRRSWVRHP